MKDKSPDTKDMTKKSRSLFGKLPHFSFKKIRNLNRNTILAGSLAILLLLVGVWSVIFNKNTSKEIVASADQQESVIDITETPSISITVSYKEGVVEYKDENGVWANAVKDTKLSTGMGLRTTGAASKATIVLDDGSTIRIDANTELTFESLTESRVVIAQDSGYIYNRIMPSKTRTYIVHTKEAQFQAVGTAFRTIANGDEEAVEVYQSSVKETSTNFSVSEGEKLVVKSANNPSKDETKEKLDIEKIKQDEFIKWNREQDLQDAKFKSSLGFLSDFDGPKIDITDPTSGSSIEVDGASPSGSVSIKGKTESKSKVTVQSKSISGSVAIEIAVGEDGSFDTGILLAPIGSSIFEFVATDPIGNKTTLNVNYTFKRKTAVQEQGIALTLDNTSDTDKIKLNWGLVGLTTPDGVKLVYDTTENPTYPEADNKKLISTGTSYELDKSDLKSGKTYYFRVCRYDAETSTCDIYSNQVSVEIP